MANSAQRRILNDYQMLLKNKDLLHESGIFFEFDEENIFRMRAMIIGPPDTPYEKGFFFFYITFPENYPNLPPKFQYETNHRNIRFNPNLYVNGYVCLSLLNTWSGGGEGWTASNNIMSILNSIQGMVLNEFPLINEPGFEIVGPDHTKYNEVLEHEKFYTAVYRMIKMTPEGYKGFSKIIEKYFLDNYQWYLDTLVRNYHKYKKQPIFTCSYQSNKTNNDYLGNFKKFIELGKTLAKELDREIDIPDPITQTKLLATEPDAKVVVKKEGMCQGKTVRGKPCGFMAKTAGFCKVHQSQVQKN